MKTHQLTDLSGQIEQLIHDHMAEYRKAAQAAVARAFNAATALAMPVSKSTATERSAAAAASRPPRRTRAEIERLSERLYEAVAANPGEAIGFLANKLGVRTQELQRPADLLRQENRLRTAGQRHMMRYFPRCRTEAAAA